MSDINTMIHDMVHSGKTVQGIADAVRAESMTTMELEAVHAERRRQDAKWGEQNHDPVVWMGILMEEVGELAQAVNETVFDNGPEARAKGGHENMRREAIHTAAVAVGLLECLDRQVIKENHK